VFENQLTDLQNGDRLYYLARTPGMNLRTQLEGNSFAELIMRNTNAHSLKADAFATADCKFELKNLAGTPPGSPSSATRWPTTRRRSATRTSCCIRSLTDDPVPCPERGRPQWHQRSERLQRHCRRRPDLRRQRQ
jgi:hypothetical protein